MAVTIAPGAPAGPAPSRPRLPASAPRRGGAAGSARLDGADALRAIAALAVIVVHTSHWALQDEGADAAVWNGVTLLARFCVPAFVVLAGLVLGYRYSGQKLGGAFLLRRARRSLLPWVVWAPVFFLFGLLATDEIEPTAASMRDWWSLGGGHLYFLLLIPQLYVVMLLWPRGRRAAAVAAGAAVAVQLALCAARLYLPLHGEVLHQVMSVHGYELFPFWVGYFAVGAATGRALAERPALRLRPMPFAALIAPAAFAMLWLDVRGMADSVDATGTGAFLRPLMLPFALAICAAVVFGAPALLRRRPRLHRATEVVSRHSLGIYILHPLLVAGIGRLLARGLHAHVPWSVAPVIGLTLLSAGGALSIAVVLSRTRLAISIGEQRVVRQPERELRGHAVQRPESPQRSSMRAMSPASRSSGGGGGAPSTRST